MKKLFLSAACNWPIDQTRAPIHAPIHSTSVMPNHDKEEEATKTTAAAAPAASESLEARLAKGLRLAETLTTPATAAAAAAAATAGEKQETTAVPAPTTASDEPAPLPEERNGIVFLFEGDLQYELPLPRKMLVDVGTAPHTFPHRCQLPGCGAVEEAKEEGKVVAVTQQPRFPACAKCRQARYCGREHQVEDWKQKQGGHKASCGQFAFLRACAEGQERLDRRDVVVKLLFKVRLHLGPFLVAHADKQGKGFGFVQSPCTLEELFLLRPVDPRGQPLERSVVVHHLTMGEFVSVVLEDDWELTFAKDSLEEALASYDPTTHYVVLLKLRCGYAAVLRVPLLGVGLCRALAADYSYAEHAELQLNID